MQNRRRSLVKFMKLLKIHYLECVSDTHNKFYEMIFFKQNDKYYIYREWGRIGTEGTRKIEPQMDSDPFISEDEAVEAAGMRMARIASEKFGKGYTEKEHDKIDLNKEVSKIMLMMI